MDNAIFVIVPVFIALVFAFIIAQIISPKFRGKIMSRQVKATKYMSDESKDDLKVISDNMAYATKDSIKTTARAIKEGLKDETLYCKYCDCEIDGDSKFCKKCGREQ